MLSYQMLQNRHCHGRHAPRAVRLLPHTNQRCYHSVCRCQTVRNAAADDTFVRLNEEVNALETQRAELDLEQLNTKATVIRKLAEEVGLSEVIPEHLLGWFRPVELGNESANEFTSNEHLTLGMLTNKAVEPSDLKVSRSPSGKRNTWREQKGDVITEFVGQIFFIDGTNLQGRVEIVITMRLDPAAPSIVFAKATEFITSPHLAEGMDATEQLQQWHDLILQHNQPEPGKTVDPSTGVIRVQMPPFLPELATYLVANSPDWQLFKVAGDSEQDYYMLFRREEGPGCS